MPDFFDLTYSPAMAASLRAAMAARRGEAAASPVAPVAAPVIPPVETAPGAVPDAREGEFMKLLSKEWQALTRWVLSLPSSQRPHDVWRVLLVIIGHVRWSDGLITLSREALAEEAGISADRAGRALGVLASAGVVERKRVPVPGVRGAGVAAYSLSAHLGGKGDLRERQASSPRPVLFVEAGSRQ